MAKISVRDRNKNNADRKPNWEYRFEAAKSNGKRHHISKSGFRTKREAEAAGIKALAEYNNAGLHFEPSEIGFNDYIDYWYKQYCVTNLKYNTLVTYTNLIEKHLKPHFGRYKLKSLNPSVLQDYANEIVKQGYSSSYVFSILSTLKTALDYAVFPLNYIKDNPIVYIRFPTKKPPKSSRGIISMEDFDRIMEQFPSGTRFHMPLLFGWFCGLRISEALAVTWDDIDFEEKTLNINKQLVKRNTAPKGSLKETYTKTGRDCAWYFGIPKYGSSRLIKLGDFLLDELKQEFARQQENEEKYGVYYTVQLLKDEQDEKGNSIKRIISKQKEISSDLPRVNLVCIDKNGLFTTKDNIRYPTRVIQERLKIKFDFHSLRHTHATMLIDSGVSPKAVQQRLGHKNVSTTLQIYVKSTENMQQEAVDAFDKIMSKHSTLHGEAI